MQPDGSVREAPDFEALTKPNGLYLITLPSQVPLQLRFSAAAHAPVQTTLKGLKEGVFFGGAFTRAAKVYREHMAAEGHRHYPLRKIPQLRRDPDLLLGLGPCFDAWGARLATYEGFREADRAEIASGLAVGIKKVKGQIGYQRALKGMDSALPGGLMGSRFQGLLSNAARKVLQDKDVKRHLATACSSFESSLKKATRKTLQGG